MPLLEALEKHLDSPTKMVKPMSKKKIHHHFLLLKRHNWLYS